MRNVYKSLMVIGTSFLLGAGTMWADGRYWTYDASAGATAPDNVQAGQPYFLQTGRSEAAGAAWFLWGDRFKSTSSLTSDFVYYFEEVPGETAKNGAKVYYIKRQNGDYLAQPGNAQLYTPSVERAWKVTVHTAENRDPEYTYSHANPDGAAPTQYKGMDAFINEAKDNNDFSNLNLAAASYLNLSNGLTITSVEANKADDPTSPFTALLNYPGDNTASNVALGTDYSRNVWLAYPASKQSAIDALKGVMQEVTGGQTLEEKIKSYQVGSGVAQYSKEKHDKLVELWNKAKAYADGTATGTDTEIEAVAEALLPAYQDFVASPNPLVPGYYIVTSWRAENGSDYDGGALYDRSAVDPGDRTLRWTLRKNDGVDYNESDPLSYNTCKMVWEVVAAKKEGQFYFRNFETGNYIGTAAALYNAISVTEAPVNTYNIQANPKIPGYFCFYSPDLPKSSAEFSGIHTERALTNVVPWDWTSDGSSWHVRTISESEIAQLRQLMEQPRRNAKLQRLVNQAQSGLDQGYRYMAVDDAGNKIEAATSGKVEAVDGLVQSADKLACPMADPQEGTGAEHELAVLLDNQTNTYFHTSWHGGNDAWLKNHYLQFSLDNAQDELLLKWVKRLNGKSALNNGAPVRVAFWGTNDASKLEVTKTTSTNADGAEVINYDAWKKDGWDSLTISTFTYPYALQLDDETKINNAVGTAHFKAPQAYKYYRMEVLTNGGNNAMAAGNKFFYGSEFRVYKGAFDKVASPIASVPEADVTALKDAITAARAELKDEKATDATIEALQKVFDKFRANYPDPARVTELIDQAQDIVKTAEEATGEFAGRLGYYKPGAKATLSAAVEAVKTKLTGIQATRQPNVTEINDMVAQLKAALTEMSNSLLQPADGIYMIQSESSNKSNNGKVIAAKGSSRDSYWTIRFEGTEPVDPKVVGAEAAYKETANRKSHLEYYWKVEKVKDGYTFKNLYTGLYLDRDTTKNGAAMRQSETPTTIGIEYANYAGAFNLIVGNGKTTNRYVNAQPDANSMSPYIVTWNAAKGADNSAFSFKAVDENELNDVIADGVVYELQSKTGFQIVTLPFAIKVQANDGFYNVVGQNATTGDIVLKKASGEIKAGQAVVYKPANDNTDNFINVMPVATDYKSLNATFTPAASADGLMGVFETTELAVQNGVLNSDRTKVLLSEKGDKVAANSGYFGKLQPTTETGDLMIPANGIITSIGAVRFAPAAAGNGIFTLGGVRVKGEKTLPAGIYVINGKKVIVK